MLALIRLSESESCQCGRAAASHLSAGLHPAGPRRRAQRPGPGGPGAVTAGSLASPTPPGGGPLPGTLRLSELHVNSRVGLAAREADGRVVVSDSMTAAAPGPGPPAADSLRVGLQVGGPAAGCKLNPARARLTPLAEPSGRAGRAPPRPGRRAGQP